MQNALILGLLERDNWEGAIATFVWFIWPDLQLRKNHPALEALKTHGEALARAAEACAAIPFGNVSAAKFSAEVRKFSDKHVALDEALKDVHKHKEESEKSLLELRKRITERCDRLGRWIMRREYQRRSLYKAWTAVIQDEVEKNSLKQSGGQEELHLLMLDNKINSNPTTSGWLIYSRPNFDCEPQLRFGRQDRGTIQKQPG